MANTMKVWLAYDGIDDTYAYEFSDVPDDALIESSVQAAVSACNARLAQTTGNVTYGYLFKYNGTTNPATKVARVSATSSQKVSIFISGGN